MMNNPKKLIKFVRKWQRVAALRRKRISQSGLTKSAPAPVMADKGHFVVYTADQRRFMFPISYLSNQIFQELLRMSKEEFGLLGNGPITLPYDASFMEYAVSLSQGCVDRHFQQALIMSIASKSCSLLSHSLNCHVKTCHPLLVCSW